MYLYTFHSFARNITNALALDLCIFPEVKADPSLKGVYVVQYQAMAAGTYRCTVTANGKPIESVPTFDISVTKEGAAAAASAYASFLAIYTHAHAASTYTQTHTRIHAHVYTYARTH